jgi:soluble lytic murein transglycosylase
MRCHLIPVQRGPEFRVGGFAVRDRRVMPEPLVPAVSRALTFLAATLLACMPASAMFDFSASGASLESQRLRYMEARAALDAGDWQRFTAKREELEGYALASYLDYERLMKRLRVTRGGRAREFVDSQHYSPLGVRYLDNYLRTAGRDRRWGDYLAAAQREPRSERLRCYYARAKRARGGEQEAWSLAETLWLSSSSVDDACDPLFKLWERAGGLRDDLVWERAELAFAAREGGLLRYVASKGSMRSRAELEALRRAYREPQRSVAIAAELEQPARGTVTSLGLERYSRYDPRRALRELERLPPGVLDAAQRERVEGAIALRGLLEREEGVREWVDSNLVRWSDDRLTGMRLRWAIAEMDWDAIRAALPALSEEARNESVWRYWLARAVEAGGGRQDAEALYALVATQRSYYGFLAADRLGLPYAFQQLSMGAARTISADTLPDWTNGTLWRVHELHAVDEPRLAHAEWSHALRRLDKPRKLDLAQIARAENWYRLAIDAANASGSWDALDLRFPLAYLDEFEQRAMNTALPVSELMAIARRESAFFPSARSPVGARGLMQLMPSTGAAVARKAGLKPSVRELYDIERNIDLGSIYYRQLLERFDGKRPLALAAYNAGPSRVQHWITEEAPMDVWIETIPYRETRDYVKAVLAYSVVFDFRLGRDSRLLTPTEQTASL